MKDLHYVRPASMTEATDYLRRHGEKAKIIAGGQSLMILLSQKLIFPSYLIDISRIADLNFIKKTNKIVKVGALTTHRTVEDSPVIKSEFPILAKMEKQLASVHIRNVGTIGGNLCHADPVSDLAPPLIALRAKVKLKSWQGSRTVLAENFFQGFFETVIKPDEMLTEVQIPLLPSSTEAVYIKHSSRVVDTTILGVAVFISKGEDKNSCKDIRIALGGVHSFPIRVKKAEAEIRGQKVSKKTIAAAGEKAKEEVDPVSDIEGSVDYRKELTDVFVRRAIEFAWEGFNRRKQA